MPACLGIRAGGIGIVLPEHCYRLHIFQTKIIINFTVIKKWPDQTVFQKYSMFVKYAAAFN